VPLAQYAAGRKPMVASTSRAVRARTASSTASEVTL
jgi:hypothetical protein